MSKDILYLGSQSFSRQLLLKNAKINYTILKHDSDECVPHANPEEFENYVSEIAKEKMRHLIIPDNLSTHKEIFVLTADTLIKSCKTNQILSKPKDINDAKRMLQIEREEEIEIVTACCLDKKEFNENIWNTKKRIIFHSSTTAEYFVPKKWEDFYLTTEPLALKGCGAAIVEGVGQCFLKSIRGSYSSAVGLPMFELLENLEKMGFGF
ncbi:TPA: hypothetical protein DEO28_01275 [Candidatus Dependentiae bacterium]|nr:MAG: Maf-like protein [candidate division TM6 bacterium GW2011_GWE2_31_21]KKP53731.1 MAG: Maf-like protein [candidate division TM6 bacterium GW2011_GWF2_33_332]HBS48515.1 hypothetical protein [Candidatus Dependentiae bacterium]HBZ73130.1 hypothetical protein [Candidatus Dependentiae bacterium]